MPRFYFAISGKTLLDDTEGTELPDLAAARRHAHVVAQELMHHCDSMLGRPWKGWTMTIKNDKGEEVLSFPIVDVTGGAR